MVNFEYEYNEKGVFLGNYRLTPTNVKYKPAQNIIHNWEKIMDTAIHLSSRYNLPVVAEIKNIEINITQNSNINQIKDEYYRKLRAR